MRTFTVEPLICKPTTQEIKWYESWFHYNDINVDLTVAKTSIKLKHRNQCRVCEREKAVNYTIYFPSCSWEKVEKIDSFS